MKDVLEERKKKALSITIMLPMNKGEEIEVEKEDDDDEAEKEGIPPSLDKEKDEAEENVKAFMGGNEEELMRKKKKGIGPRNLEERASMAMLKDD
jgi:hypothetical protein